MVTVEKRTNIRSTLSPFWVASGCTIKYPDLILQALGRLYKDYNQSFTSLVEKNREWHSDYQYCMEPEGPISFAVQIDMAGISNEFMRETSEMPLDQVRGVLRRNIFEVENSIAMYQLLENIFSNDQSSFSFFKRRWREVLDDLRKKWGMPIALLAITEEKFRTMKATEFGKEDDEITEAETRELSGFDKLFGPEEFRQYLDKKDGRCEYLLFLRSSDPVEKLKKPDTKVGHPLLGNSEIRKVIKANTITLNVDDPDMDKERKINDTKEYMPIMGMAFPAYSEEDLYSPEFYKRISAGKSYTEFQGERLSAGLVGFLKSCGINPREVELGKVALRGKPGKETYGCYGHVSGTLNNRDFRGDLRRELKRRGLYMIQPKIETPVSIISDQKCEYIDRVFFGYIKGSPVFMGGFRSFMPLNSIEAKQGRNHGNRSTIWAEIS